MAESPGNSAGGFLLGENMEYLIPTMLGVIIVLLWFIGDSLTGIFNVLRDNKENKI